jgi:hypothetical protein
VEDGTFTGLVQTSDLTVDGDRGLSLAGAKFEGVTRFEFSSNVRLDRTVVRGPLTLVPRKSAPTSLDSLAGATLESPLIVPDGVSLHDCELAGAIGLGNLHIPAADPDWPKRWGRWGRRVLADENSVHGSSQRADSATLRGIEGSYRALRAALEDAKAAPAAADFYYSEMEMRRLAASNPSIERALLRFYWLVSGYGLRAWRALASYAFTLLVVSAALRLFTRTFVSDEAAAAGGLSFHRFADVIAFVARSSVSFLSAPITGLTAWGTALLLLTRFSAPVFLALAILAIRARVHR